MPVTAVALQGGVTLTGALSPIVTGGGGQTVITQAIFTNPTGGAVSLTVTVTRQGGSALTLIPARQVAAGSTSMPPELVVFPIVQGDVISASGAGLVAYVNGYTA
jgi:hypothetical protein